MSAATLHPPPAERLARIIDGLCAAIAARGIGGLLTAPLIFLLWGRLKRAALRARRLAEKIAAGKPLTTARRRDQPPRPGRPPPPRLPRGYAWVIRLVPAAAPAASQLRALLEDPEMAPLAQAPPMRRLLRPLCQMLGVEPPEIPKHPAATSPLPLWERVGRGVASASKPVQAAPPPPAESPPAKPEPPSKPRATPATA